MNAWFRHLTCNHSNWACQKKSMCTFIHTVLKNLAHNLICKAVYHEGIIKCCLALKDYNQSIFLMYIVSRHLSGLHNNNQSMVHGKNMSLPCMHLRLVAPHKLSFLPANS